jgi:hypothetical protein
MIVFAKIAQNGRQSSLYLVAVFGMKAALKAVGIDRNKVVYMNAWVYELMERRPM